MTREEAIAILNHKVSACLHGTEWGEALEMAIKALSDFPYVKYTENGMEPDFDMANAFFNFDAPMVANANQHNSNASNDDGQRINALEGDAVSRQAVLDITWEEPSYTDALNVLTEVRDKVKALPSVNPQQKTGHWISEVTCIGAKIFRCSNCDFTIPKPKTKINYCSNCGFRMVDPQESEERT